MPDTQHGDTTSPPALILALILALPLLPHILPNIMQECRLAMEQDQVDCIVLGCAGMADLCQAISRELGVPVIDGVSAAVTFAESMVRLGLQTSKRGEWNYPLAKQYL